MTERQRELIQRIEARLQVVEAILSPYRQPTIAAATTTISKRGRRGRASAAAA